MPANVSCIAFIRSRKWNMFSQWQTCFIVLKTKPDIFSQWKNISVVLKSNQSSSSRFIIFLSNLHKYTPEIQIGYTHLFERSVSTLHSLDLHNTHVESPDVSQDSFFSIYAKNNHTQMSYIVSNKPSLLFASFLNGIIGIIWVPGNASKNVYW